MTNKEMHECISRGKNRPESDQNPHWVDQQTRLFWDKLVKFSKDRTLLENDFNEKMKNHFHECFWELYLPKAFDAFGITLHRGCGKSAKPDFYFEKNGLKVWVEAVACGEPEEQNRIPSPTNDFSGGIAPEDKIMQRLANAISEKIKKPYATTHEPFIIALNGHRALNGYPHDLIPLNPSFVVRTLFGMGSQFLTQSGGKYFKYTEKTQHGAPIAHFSNPENKNIAGVLYSASHIGQTALPLGHDFAFIQNPYAPDIRNFFNFCKKGIWIREDLRNGNWALRLKQENPQ